VNPQKLLFYAPKKTKMKRFTISFFMIAFAAIAISLTSCKSTPKDADIKTAVETALKADPMAAGLMVDVKDGVATLSGECKDDACKTHCADMVKGIKGVKSIVDNCTIAAATPPPVVPVVTDAAADALTKAVNDALKDFPGVTGTVKDQILTLAGQISKDKVQKLMMGLNALKAMGLKSIDSKSLVKK
jgi:hyperosmotically inducible periplasmic protein